MKKEKKKKMPKFDVGDIVTIAGWANHHWRITGVNQEYRRYQLECITLRHGERVAVPVSERELTMVKKHNGLKHAIWRMEE